MRRTLADDQRITLEHAAEIERLRAALQRIADWCPATQEMTLAHQMADEAQAALAEKDAANVR